MTDTQKPLTSDAASTVADPAVALDTEAKASIPTTNTLQSDFKAALYSYLEAIASNATSATPETSEQLKTSSSVAASFVAALEESVFKAKASTTQGLLLTQALSSGSITQEQFKTSVNQIDIDSQALIQKTAVELPAIVQNLLLAIANQQQASAQAKLLETAAEAAASAQAAEKTAQTDEVLAAAKQAAASSTTPPNSDSPNRKLGEGKVTVFEKDTQGNILKDAQGNPITKELDAKGVDGKGTGATPGEVAKEPTAETDPVLSGKKSLIQKAEETSQTDDKLGNNASYLEKLIKIASEIAANNLKASAASFLSINPQPRIVSGARAIIKINGKVTGLCTNVSYNIDMNWQEIRGIDELIPNDLAPSSFSVTGSMTLYRVPNNSPISNYIHADMFQGMIWPYTTIEIKDKRTDELLVLIKRCAITSRAESYSHGQPVTTTMNFIGIGFRDEEIPKFMPDKLK